MYGKDFHQWREAQDIIARIEAEEPEVRDMIRQRYRSFESPLSAALHRRCLGAHSPEVSLMRQIAAQSPDAQYEALCARSAGSPFGGILGFWGR